MKFLKTGALVAAAVMALGVSSAFADDPTNTPTSTATPTATATLTNAQMVGTAVAGTQTAVAEQTAAPLATQTAQAAATQTALASITPSATVENTSTVVAATNTAIPATATVKPAATVTVPRTGEGSTTGGFSLIALLLGVAGVVTLGGAAFAVKRMR